MNNPTNCNRTGPVSGEVVWHRVDGQGEAMKPSPSPAATVTPSKSDVEAARRFLDKHFPCPDSSDDDSDVQELASLIAASRGTRALTEAMWLVFSHEHGAYWRPNRRGYTVHVESAGRYTYADAHQICDNARSPRGDEAPNEVVVPSPELISRLTGEPSA